MDTNELGKEPTLLDALKTAIELEEYGYSFYKDVRGFVKSEKGRALLEFLAGQEMDHKKWLEAEHSNLKKEIKEEKRSDERLNMELPNPWIIFSRTDEITKSMDSIEATRFAIEIEKRSMEFYSACGQMTGIASAKDLFKKLVRFEDSHLKILEENLSYLETEGDWYGYVPILEG